MGPELEKLESSSAVTDLETPGQQCPPNEGVWETGRITANGFLTTGVGSRKKGNSSSSTERATRTVTVAGISPIATTPSQRRHNTSSEENKQFDPGGQGEKARLGTRLYSTFFFWGELVSSVLLSVCASCSVLSVCLFSEIMFFSSGDTSQQAESHEERSRIKPMKYANGGQAFSRLLPF